MLHDVRSPDGRVLVQLSCNEYLPTQWVCCPRVTLEPEGEVLLDMWDVDAWRWDAQATFGDDGTLRLLMRAYPSGTKMWMVVVDPGARTYRVESGPAPPRPLVERLGQLLRPADDG